MFRRNCQTSTIVQFDGLQVGDKNRNTCTLQAFHEAGRAGFEPANEDLAPLTA